MRAIRLAATFILFAARPVMGQHEMPAGESNARLTPTAIRADLAFLRERVLGGDKSYTAESKRAAGARLALLEAAADTLHRAYFELEVARIAALADNGHSNAPGVMRANRVNRVGIRLAPFGEDFYVLGAQPAFADLLGARVVSVDGRPIVELRTIARTLTGGAVGWRDRSVGYYLESPELMQALGSVQSADAATYGFELADGRRVERRIVAEAPGGTTSFASASRWMSPNPVATSGPPWKTVVADATAPWSLRDWAQRFRFRDAPEIDGVVVELRQNNAAAGQPIMAFLDSATRMLNERKPTYIVLDLRFNGSGDLNKTRDFVQRLPKIASGRIFVLTSPHTFSAAISTVGYLKQAAPDRVSIVGEMVGDRLEFFAEGRGVDLPNSGIGIGVSTQRHDYKTGCKPFSDCHGNVVRFPISVPTFAPDIPAPWTILALREGKDPAMEAVAKALGKR